MGELIIAPYKHAHLLEYDVDRHDDWFFARELQNGVITLKIPRLLFTGSAAKITMQPDNYYKSGYLWKTLYPIGYTEDDIIRTLNEAFNNIDRDDSNYPTSEQGSGVLYGYALVNAPLKTIKLRIQLRGNQIQSVFPAWEQPFTGNTGKPYSHSNSISFNIAESTVYYEKFSNPWGHIFQEESPSADALLDITPTFILHRPRRDSSITIDNWRDMREKELMEIAPSMSYEDLQRIENYLQDYVCSKNPYGVQYSLYTSLFDQICQDDELFNAAQLFENIAECIQVLTHSDIENGTRRAIDAMVRFISMAVVHTGGLCTLQFKRVLGEFLKAALGHPDENSSRDFFAALASSSCRAALYSEFDLSPFVKENNKLGRSLFGFPEVDIELKPGHLYEYLSLNLGENYLLTLSKDERLAIARGCFPTAELHAMVADTMLFLSGIDFQFFMPIRLNPGRLAEKSPPSEEDLTAVVRDYSRMLVIYRQRIVMEDPDAYKAEIDPEKVATEENFNLIRQKHKRAFVWMMHEAMLKGLIKLADHLGYDNLKAKSGDMLSQLPKEVIPTPKPVPDYILDRQDKLEVPVQDVSVDNLVELILGLDSHVSD
ncbi:hypothetical protein EcCFBP13530_20470 [Enterobacter cancerogenus]|uniref:Uncharacterized protein n=1 Tax=Enterobacter cancerogenus TaxID=69218 RepID=A0AB38P050_9ENTR|nr:hypothetical protein [Enterobacter cancerogenus]TKK15782.1 hypothetical protein EcCFBP13530_20470 [Enterobacter cancerogenus]